MALTVIRGRYHTSERGVCQRAGCEMLHTIRYGQLMGYCPPPRLKLNSLIMWLVVQ